MLARLRKYRASEVPVRYPPGNPRLDPSRCDPPLDYWFASDEPGLADRCQGSYRPPPSPPPKPAAHPGPAVRFESANDSSLCLVAPGAEPSAWLEVGACGTNRSLWRRTDGPQLESVGFPGRYINVFGGPPACCPGGASSKFHLIDRPGGPGNRFEFAQGQIELADVSRWHACAGLCAVPSQPRVTLRPCPAEPQWREVRAQD